VLVAPPLLVLEALREPPEPVAVLVAR
jgi:hypothetical protein